jgi:hypothetical protein
MPEVPKDDETRSPNRSTPGVWWGFTATSLIGIVLIFVVMLLMLR